MTLSTTTKLVSLALCVAASSSSVALADTTTTTTTTTTTSGSSSGPSTTDGGDSRTSLGFRVGFATPSGNIGEDDDGKIKLKDKERGAVLVQADLDFRLLSWLHAGLYAGVGFGLIGSEYTSKCAGSESDCSAYTWLAGAQAEVRLLPTNAFDPWFGVSIGVDGVNTNVDTQKLEESLTAWGVDVGASAGLDIQFDSFAVGPYVSGLAGRYGSSSYRSFDPRGYERRDGKVVGRDDEHYWLTVGIRGRFGL